MSARSMTVGVTASQKADDTCLADFRCHLVASVAQALRREGGRSRFLHRQLGMGMNILVERLEDAGTRLARPFRIGSAPRVWLAFMA